MPNAKVGYYTKLDPQLLAAMERYRDVVGVPVAVQIDKAMREWLEPKPEAGLVPAKGGTKKKG